MAKVIELTDENFESEMKNTDKPVLIDFYAPWCGHCRVQSPIIDDFAKDIDGDAVIAKLNVDSNREKAAEYFISGIPAILLFKNGKLVEQKAGVQHKGDLQKMVDKHK